MDGPVSVSISSKKVVQTTRTVGGYTFSHFGDEPDILQAKGSVILMPGREGLGFLSLLILKTLYRLDKKAIKNILQAFTKYAIPLAAFTATAAGELYAQKVALGSNASVASLAALGTETLMAGAGLELMREDINKINSDLSTTYIYHDNYIYRGFFTNFSYTRDANNPRFINYQFSFTIDWSTENTFADILLKLTNGSTISGFGG